MSTTTKTKAWLLGISFMMLGSGMGACSMGGETSWKEEVLLHDGSKLVVERTVSRKGRHELGQRPPIGYQRLSFTLPGTHQKVNWVDEYSKDVGSANFLPMGLEIFQGKAYLVVSPMGCLSYNKWGRPNPPYVIFEYDGKTWQRIPLQELPPEFKVPNLIISTPDDEAKKLGTSLISAEKVKEVNTGFQQPEYQTIRLKPLKNEWCPGWVFKGFKAPLPIPSKR